MLGKDIRYTIKRLGSNTMQFVGEFDCGNLEINDYINTSDAFYTRNTVNYLLLEIAENGNKQLIGLLSLSCSAIVKIFDCQDKNGNPINEFIPAALIEYFAITKRYHGLPFDQFGNTTFSEAMFSVFIDLITNIITKKIGAQYIILHSTREAYNFYKKKFYFSEFAANMSVANNPHVSDCIPMYLMIDSK